MGPSHTLSLLVPSVVVNQEAEESGFVKVQKRLIGSDMLLSHSIVSSIVTNHLWTWMSAYILFVPGIINLLFLAVYFLITLSTPPLKHTASMMSAVGNHHARTGTNCSTKLSVSAPWTAVLCCETMGKVTNWERMAISKWQCCILSVWIHSNKIKQPYV